VTVASDRTGESIRRVRAVVLNWNGGALVESCIEHLLATRWPDGSLEVVVVDNASTDGSQHRLAERFGDAIRLVHNAHNDGFPANNLAMDDLRHVDAIALLNNDALVEPDWLVPLAAALDADDGLGATCPLIVLASPFAEVLIDAPTFDPGGGDPRHLGVQLTGVRVDGIDRWGDVLPGDDLFDLELGRHGPFRWTGASSSIRVPIAAGDGVEIEMHLAAETPKTAIITTDVGSVSADIGTEPAWVAVRAERAVDVVQNAGSVVFSDGYSADRHFGAPRGLAVAAAADVTAWCGGAVLLRSAYLRDVGLFHEPYFLYYEDTDLSWRGRARGWRYRFVPTSVVRHAHAASSGTASTRFWHFNERNRLLLLARNAPGPLVRREVRSFAGETAHLAWQDTIGPLRRRRRPRPAVAWRRARAFAAFLCMAPGELGSRRALRRRQVVSDAELLAPLPVRSP